MRQGSRAPYGAAAGAAGIVLFVAGSLVMGDRPAFDAGGAEIAADLEENRTRIQGSASFVVSGVLAAFAVLVLGHAAVWPRWIGWLAAVAAALYLLRAGTLFATDGAFAADGVLGLYVPVVAVAGWVLIASVALAVDLVDRSREAR
jgi:hypothetical protein